MLLPDSNIFISYWNNYDGVTERYEKIMQSEGIYICGIVRAELLHGALSKKQMDAMTELFDGFDEINLGDGDWQTLGENMYTLKRNGISVPLGDAIIATTAQRYGVPIWSRDKHFQMMRDILAFDMYEEPQ